MGDHDLSRIDHENHLLLDQPQLRLPFELLRKNLRSAHFEVEKDAHFIKNTLKETATGSVNGRTSQEDVLKSLDAMIARARGIKRKLGAFADEENRLHRQEEARVAHLAELHSLHTVDDVKYESWSRTRLDRLLVDYLLRHGYNDSARALAKERGIERLVDVDIFEQMSRIRKSLLSGSVTEALAWCTAGDNKKELRKISSNLEFMLRYQQYIEIVRNRSQTRPNEALAHARKYLIPFRDTYPKEVLQACGMLAIPPGRAQSMPPYEELYSPARWQMLADLFTTTHNTLLQLPPVPLLHIALSSGLSALKTPACHSTSHHSSSAPGTGPPEGSMAALLPRRGAVVPGTACTGPPSQVPASASSSSSGTTSVCPVCSTELNALARAVPYAHHAHSNVEPDLVMLPNSRAYGRRLLEEHARKAGLTDRGLVRDIRTGEVFPYAQLKKVFIT